MDHTHICVKCDAMQTTSKWIYKYNEITHEDDDNFFKCEKPLAQRLERERQRERKQ